MNPGNDKLTKLFNIASLYYEQDKTQNEIAAIYGVSRPLISRMLKEAKELGIVKIELCHPFREDQELLVRLNHLYHIKGGVLIENKSSDSETNKAITSGALDYMKRIRGKRYGIGWGGIIGQLISDMEKRGKEVDIAEYICPLLGNSGVSNRNYHSNELVRIFADRTDAQPEYLYAPALAAAEQELGLIKALENYKTVYDCWNRLDVALVNIGNYPSTPDFASVARYGDTLKKRQAVGRLLNYFFDINGKILASDMDYAVQIPIEILRQTPNVVGIAAANIHPKALLGALRTGIFHHIIAPEQQIGIAIEAEE